MKNIFYSFILLAVIFTLPMYAQDSTAVPRDTTWKHSLVAALNLTQVAFTNWVQGGQNALAYEVGAEGKSTMNNGAVNLDNQYKFAFGQARLGTQGLRKTDDKIDLASVLTYKIDSSSVNPYASATLKTQFARGYSYDQFGIATPVSKFFDPGYLQQSVGAAFQPIQEIKVRVGTGLREIFTSEFPGYADDPATPEIEKTSIDGGIEAVTDIHWEIDKNLLFTSKIELFDAYKALDVVIVHSDNTITARVSKFVIVSLNAQLINEKRVSPATQYEETLSMGLTYTLF